MLFILRVKPIRLASCFMFSWNKVYLPLVCKAATRHDTIEQLGGESSAVLESWSRARQALLRHWSYASRKPCWASKPHTDDKILYKAYPFGPGVHITTVLFRPSSCWGKDLKVLLNVCISAAQSHLHPCKAEHLPPGPMQTQDIPLPASSKRP